MPSGNGRGPANPVTWSFAALVLLALAGLVVLRHFKGTISIS